MYLTSTTNFSATNSLYVDTPNESSGNNNITITISDKKILLIVILFGKFIRLLPILLYL